MRKRVKNAKGTEDERFKSLSPKNINLKFSFQFTKRRCFSPERGVSVLRTGAHYPPAARLRRGGGSSLSLAHNRGITESESWSHEERRDGIFSCFTAQGSPDKTTVAERDMIQRQRCGESWILFVCYQKAKVPDFYQVLQ